MTEPVFTREMLAVLRAFRDWYDAMNGFCPKCQDQRGWKMSEPPICVTCGFRPVHSATMEDTVAEVANRIETLLPPAE